MPHWSLPEPRKTEITLIESDDMKKADRSQNRKHHKIQETTMKPSTSQSGKDYKAVSKILGLEQTTVADIK